MLCTTIEGGLLCTSSNVGFFGFLLFVRGNGRSGVSVKPIPGKPKPKTFQNHHNRVEQRVSVSLICDVKHQDRNERKYEKRRYLLDEWV